jgi:glucose-6-phosphate 1-dehydrogenase
MIERLVIFGATGDLTRRLLLPALAQLGAAGKLPHGFTVTGAARAQWDDDTFRANARQHLDEHAADLPAEVRERLVNDLYYRPVDVTDPGSVAAVLRAATGGVRTLRYPPLPIWRCPPR